MTIPNKILLYSKIHTIKYHNNGLEFQLSNICLITDVTVAVAEMLQIS